MVGYSQSRSKPSALKYCSNCWEEDANSFLPASVLNTAEHSLQPPQPPMEKIIFRLGYCFFKETNLRMVIVSFALSTCSRLPCKCVKLKMICVSPATLYWSIVVVSPV